ncbi:MAG: TIGR02450 family Trp-rich protein [Kofleriaceae bacterium]
MPRQQRRFLLHSRWTALVPVGGSTERHFEVVAVGRDLVTVRAVLTRRDYQLDIDALDDVAVWSPGWRSLVTATARR